MQKRVDVRCIRLTLPSGPGYGVQRRGAERGLGCGAWFVQRGGVCAVVLCAWKRESALSPSLLRLLRKLRMRLSPRQKETKASVACVRCSLGLAGASHHPSFGVWPAPEASSLLKYPPSDHPKGLKPPPNSQNTPPWYPNPHPSTTIHAHQPRHLP